MMRKLFFYIATLSLLFPVYTSGWAAEGADHQAYKVKYYNLGSLFTPQETGVKRHLGGYRPLLIMDGSADILSNEYHGSVSLIEGENYSSNSSGVAFSARYDATDRISVLGAFGMNRNYLATDPLDGKNESGWEANLGFMYRFIGNFSYEMHFGYMDPGDLFTERSSYTDVEHVIMVNNRLTMSF